MENEHLFVLGRDKELSLLELESYFGCRSIKFSVADEFKNIVVLKLPEMNFSKVINDLGGVIKIAEVCDVNSLVFSKGKISYGVNHYSDGFNISVLKDKFKSERVKALHKFSKVNEIMPTDSLKLDLEFVFYKKLYSVVAVYNPKKYKLRDETRLYYDSLKVTSLRLAKILINLSCVTGKKVLVDCFCGLGTILQESCLMGLKCIGVDKSLDTVKKCRKNLFKYKGWKVICGDACKLEEYFDIIDGVATEPYLGPYLKKIPKYKDALKIVSELKVLYGCFLKSLSKVLNGRAVVIVPVFKTDKGKIDICFDKMLNDNNFKVLPGFPYKYALKGCKIERMIYVFSKQ